MIDITRQATSQDEYSQILKAILQQQQRTNELLEQIATVLKADDSPPDSEYDPQIMEALMLLTARPEAILWGGKVAITRLAEKVGCDKRKLTKSSLFMRALEKTEGVKREAVQGHVNRSMDDSGSMEYAVDGVTEIDWSQVDDHLDEM